MTDVITRARRAVDQTFGEHYAIKNPDLVGVVARMLFDDFAILRAHHGRKK